MLTAYQFFGRMLWFIPPPAAPHLWPLLLLLLSLSVRPSVRCLSVRPSVRPLQSVLVECGANFYGLSTSACLFLCALLTTSSFPSCSPAVSAFHYVPLRRHLLSFSFTIFASIILRSLSLLSMLFHFFLLLLLLLSSCSSCCCPGVAHSPSPCCCCCCCFSSSFDLLCMFIDQQTKPNHTTVDNHQHELFHYYTLMRSLSLCISLCVYVYLSHSLSLYEYSTTTHTDTRILLQFLCCFVVRIGKKKKSEKKLATNWKSSKKNEQILINFWRFVPWMLLKYKNTKYQYQI